MKIEYQTYAWIGLIGVVFSLIALIGLFIPSSLGIFTFSFLYFLSIVTAVVFRWAFIDIAKKTKNTTLQVGNIGILIINLITSFILLISFSLSKEKYILTNQTELFQMMGGFYLLAIVLLSSFLIVTGIGFLGLKKKFKGLATATGVLHIISGSLYLTFLLAFLGVFTMIATFILEIIILFKADKIIK